MTRHVPGEQREPRGCLGTAGGAERSRKGSHPATKGVRGVRGRPGEGAREGLQPHFGAGGSPSPGVRSSWCHFVTSLPLQRHPAGCWSCRAAVETSPVPGPSPLFLVTPDTTPLFCRGKLRHQDRHHPRQLPTRPAAPLFQTGGRTAFGGALEQTHRVKTIL